MEPSEALSLSDRDQKFRFLRSLLILGRVSNLPTVWSNCLVAWLLQGGDISQGLFIVFLGATFLYLGGMYLNDAMDVKFDTAHRPERPIPSGVISLKLVWILGVSWMLAGALILGARNGLSAWMTAFLVVSILLYDWVHKGFTHSPIIMAACRFFLFLAAAAGFQGSIDGSTVWFAVVLACYIVGLSYVARQESLSSVLNAWPCVLLLAPIGLSYLVNDGFYAARALFLSVVFVGWVYYSLRMTFWGKTRNVGATVSGLLAGIVLVDLLAIVGGSFQQGVLLIGFFVAALFLQRWIPAT